MIKVRIDKCEEAGYWYEKMIGYSVLVEQYRDLDKYWLLFGSGNLVIAKSCCTVIGAISDPHPEPKVINVSNETAEKVREIFEVNQLKPAMPEPVLIARAGEFVKLVSSNIVHVIDSNKPYKLIGDYYEFGDVVLEFGGRYTYSFIKQNNMKFEKVSPKEEVKESEPVPFDLELWKSGKYDVVTRGGNPVRILCTDRIEEGYPIFGFCLEKGVEWGAAYTLGGIERSDSKRDLFLAPKTNKVWVNVYHDNLSHPTFEEAKHNIRYSTECNYIETVQITKPMN